MPPRPVLLRGSGPVPTAGWRCWVPLAVVVCGTAVLCIDSFAVNVALPSLQRGLDAGPAAVEWIIAGVQLPMAALMICGARAGDRYGRRRWFSIGLAAFVAGSALCAVAPSPGFLIACRIGQGVGAAMMTPQILAIIGVTYAGAAQVRAVSIFAIVGGTASIGGEVIGGVVLQIDPLGLGWRAIFWVVVPIGGAALLLAQRWVPESTSGEVDPLDLLGAALLLLAMVACMLPLIDGRQAGWPWWSWACLAASVPLAALLVAHLRRAARRGDRPLLDLRLFSGRTLRCGLATQLCVNGQQAASFLVIALFLQEGRRLSPLGAGGMFAIGVAGYFAGSWWAPALTRRLGRDLVAIGALLAAGGVLLLALAAGVGGVEVPLPALAPGLLLWGGGQGLCGTPLIAAVLGGADAGTAGSVTGLLTTAQLIGDAAGIGVIGLVFFSLLPGGATTAFVWSSVAMSVLLIGAAAFSRGLAGAETDLAAGDQAD